MSFCEHEEDCPKHYDNAEKPMYNPGRVLLTVLLDGVIIAFSYIFISCVLDKCTSFSTDGVITFFSVFIPLGFALRSFEMEYQEQLVRVAMFHLATKMFNSLTLGPML